MSTVLMPCVASIRTETITELSDYDTMKCPKLATKVTFHVWSTQLEEVLPELGERRE